MKLLIVILLLGSLTITGCANTKTYIFQKERVDQRPEGNRGYVLGTPPPAPVVQGVPKRTLIGVDIEIPLLPGEKIELPPQERAPEVQAAPSTAQSPVPQARSQSAPPRGPAPVEPASPAIEEEEEEWIK